MPEWWSWPIHAACPFSAPCSLLAVWVVGPRVGAHPSPKTRPKVNSDAHHNVECRVEWSVSHSHKCRGPALSAPHLELLYDLHLGAPRGAHVGEGGALGEEVGQRAASAAGATPRGAFAGEDVFRQVVLGAGLGRGRHAYYCDDECAGKASHRKVFRSMRTSRERKLARVFVPQTSKRKRGGVGSLSQLE